MARSTNKTSLTSFALLAAGFALVFASFRKRAGEGRFFTGATGACAIDPRDNARAAKDVLHSWLVSVDIPGYLGLRDAVNSRGFPTVVVRVGFLDDAQRRIPSEICGMPVVVMVDTGPVLASR